MGCAAFVATHHVPDGWPRPESTVQFVTDIERCSSEIGCRPEVGGVHGAQTIQQCLDARLLDEIHIDLAAVLLGAGVRLFDHLANTPVVLGNPTVVTRWVSRICATRAHVVDQVGRVELHRLEPTVDVRGLHHPHGRPRAPPRGPPNRPRPASLPAAESEFDEGRRRGLEAVDHNAQVLHALDRHTISQDARNWEVNTDERQPDGRSRTSTTWSGATEIFRCASTSGSAHSESMHTPGDDGTLINEHDEAGSGQEELYIVLDGKATFEIDGAAVDAPAGTFVFVGPEVRRKATGDGTVLAVGATPGEAYEGVDWGEAWPFHRESMTAYSEQRYADALEAVRGGLEHVPEHAGLHYTMCVLRNARGRHRRRHVRAPPTVRPTAPRFREDARRDDDFAAVRDDPQVRGGSSLSVQVSTFNDLVG